MSNNHFTKYLRKKLAQNLPQESVESIMNKFYIRFDKRSAIVDQSTVKVQIHKKIDICYPDSSRIKADDITVIVKDTDTGEHIVIVYIMNEMLMFFLG